MCTGRCAIQTADRRVRPDSDGDCDGGLTATGCVAQAHPLSSSDRGSGEPAAGVGNWVSAVRLAAKRHPDVVLMGIEMPGGDGITATAPW